ncbi:hypothetical protein Sta7437_4456 [Stanieria cyanosphaera PCC 7437]|uniref:Uncharacterized protein n=1 Tax=Stanieria cyanosphaera (strain ATCC 29371 / PCC 7437) TaxID=111780 RepID=K9Y0K3_STAC7|nr:DUF6391 domain-containing protein [Stanieria cyanosphaera]AFZ37921.1 hypothetical protein Sta7437_4456 [Stanieria cyanosphaera PCC 7437]
MTNAASAHSGNFWNFDFFSPHPAQDSELLQQLGFIPGLKEFLLIRQVHALEHATVWVLSDLERSFSPQRDLRDLRDNEQIGGLSTEKGFYLYGNIHPLNLKRAVGIALNRLLKGEWDLAVHPRCGTNVSVAMLLTTGMIFTTYLLLPREPIGQLVGLGIATTTAAWIAPEIGMSVQKYLTTSIPFNLKIKEIAQTTDQLGRPAHFVSVKWQNSP